MAGKERLADIGRRRGLRLRREIGQSARELRLGLGLSQASVGRALGVSAAQIGRWERAEASAIDLIAAASLMRVLGQDLTMKWYPSGAALRDAAHVSLVQRFVGLLPDVIRAEIEAPIPGFGDMRAWDVELGIGSVRIGVAAETAVRDLQALIRREQLKARDSQVDRILLVVAGTHANRRVMRESSGLIKTTFPMESRAVLKALRAGVDPGTNGFLFL
jgi:transcriptional regulator with XRE-family HTH domain